MYILQYMLCIAVYIYANVHNHLNLTTNNVNYFCFTFEKFHNVTNFTVSVVSNDIVISIYKHLSGVVTTKKHAVKYTVV